MTYRTLLCCAAAAAAIILPCHSARAEDSRHGELRTLDSYHPFQSQVETAAGWPAQAEKIQRRVQMAAGLWPMPAKTPLEAVIHGSRDLGDYTIEKVYFQSFPGHYVTGNLYRPAGESLDHGVRDGKRPGVLCPHGHWNRGRFLDQSDESRAERQVRNALATGAERFVAAARSPLQARCVQLARMGCVVFHYDMLAEADSIQFSSHKIGPRPHLDNLEKGEWGFSGAAAAAWLETSFGLQTWNSVRALDFLLSLPEVDPQRILVTGASGGGTQTLMITAVDDRVTASFPCVMPSTAMQGGCTCENSHLLRIGQGNIDIAAASAPHPLGMTAADDWTIELETKGHPGLVALYTLLGKKENYEAHFNTHFKHNYNHVSRTQMYNFANRHFGLGFEEPVLERDFDFMTGADLTVWDPEHPAPSGAEVGDAHEKALCARWTGDAEKQLRPLLHPKDGAALEKAREVIGGAVEVMIGRSGEALAGAEFEWDLQSKEDRGAYLEMQGVVSDLSRGEEVTAIFLYPKDWNRKAVVWVDPGGKAGLFDPDGSPRLEVMRLVDGGFVVAGPDLFRQEEGDKARNRDVSAGIEIRAGQEWRRDALYTYGYNHPLFAQRVHDVLTLATFIRSNPRWDTQKVILSGARGAGHWVAAAAAAGGDLIDAAAADLGGFQFGKLASVWDPDFLPGGAKFGDVAGFLVLSAPRPLWVTGIDKPAAAALRKTYAAAGAEESLVVFGGSPEAAPAKLADWLLK